MAHEIDTTTGAAAVFVTGKPAWHKLGTVVAQAQTSPIVRPCQIKNPATPPATSKTSHNVNESQASQAPAATTRLPSSALS